IDDDQGGLALQRRVNVEFLQIPSAIVDLFARNLFQAFEQGGGFRAAVRLHQADDDVDSLGLDPLRAQKHGEGLADTGGGAEKDLQPATSLAPGESQQRVGVWAAVEFAIGGHSLSKRVERHIQQENIDAALAEKAEPRLVDMAQHQVAHIALV